LNLGTLEAMECCKKKLTFDFLHDLHGGEVDDEASYIQKMLMSKCNGGLWGDFNTILRISQYLQCSIHICNKIIGQIMMKVGNNYDNQTLNIIYGNNHSNLVDFSFENTICSNVDKYFVKK